MSCLGLKYNNALRTKRAGGVNEKLKVVLLAKAQSHIKKDVYSFKHLISLSKMSNEEKEGRIENYEEFFDEILDDYQRLVSMTRLPEFMFREDDLPENEFQWGKTCGNILIKNEANKRPPSGLGLLFAEQWMIFPELVEPAVIGAVNEGNSRILGKCHFSLHSFTEVKASFTFADPKIAEDFRFSWENGEIPAEIAEKMQKAGYDGELCIRYFNSDLTEELKLK